MIARESIGLIPLVNNGVKVPFLGSGQFLELASCC